MAKVLVFDFGASSARAIITEYNGREFISEEIHRFPNNPIERDGTLYWDIDYLLSEVDNAVAKAKSKGFDGISVDTWGVDFAIVDDEGGFIERPVHYRDNRTRAVIDEVNELFGGEKELYRRTGIQPAWFNTIYQLYALNKARPESLKKGHFLMMPDLICNHLTGEIHNEYAEATTTGFLNPETKKWDEGILGKMGIAPDIFPEIINTGDIYGYLKEEYSDGRKIPVIAVPSHDTAAAVAAVPSSEREFVFISTGTWALFGTELEAPVITDKAYKAELTNEGGHSGTITLLKNIMGMWLFQECKKDFEAKGEPLSFGEMEKLAEGAEPYRFFINPNDESFSQPGDMPEKIRSFIMRTRQGAPENTAQILRAVYDSLACEFACTLRDIEDITGRSFDTLYMFGGGTKDKLICARTAEMTGCRVVAGPTEATSLGNAVCAFVGTRAIGSVAEAREIIRSSGLTAEFLPDTKTDREGILEKYRSIVK